MRWRQRESVRDVKDGFQCHVGRLGKDSCLCCGPPCLAAYLCWTRWTCSYDASLAFSALPSSYHPSLRESLCLSQNAGNPQKLTPPADRNDSSSHAHGGGPRRCRHSLTEEPAVGAKVIVVSALRICWRETGAPRAICTDTRRRTGIASQNRAARTALLRSRSLVLNSSTHWRAFGAHWSKECERRLSQAIRLRRQHQWLGRIRTWLGITASPRAAESPNFCARGRAVLGSIVVWLLSRGRLPGRGLGSGTLDGFVHHAPETVDVKGGSMKRRICLREFLFFQVRFRILSSRPTARPPSAYPIIARCVPNSVGSLKRAGPLSCHRGRDRRQQGCWRIKMPSWKIDFLEDLQSLYCVTFSLWR